ncbi:efflux RND transporter periplasmic adaptor subunit [Pelobacter seleniigenes]|uniref:efflux RND transporter periplasmic adaptor subunit n=1 Tax=Pelobacter seleniigenes TaxID=407188 RepID=UPI0004A6C302|nr:efflux RND transporter periplasmic adaptor subunit [Pelobacter seleniigenes]
MKTTQQQADSAKPSLEQLLNSPAGKRSRWRWWWLILILVVIGAAVVPFFRAEEKAAGPQYATEAVSRGTLQVKVSATGNLQPTNQVDVGSELSGIVEQVFVDVNDHVSKGQELARLDRSKLEDAVTRSRANLAAAQAQVMQTEATVEESNATLERYRQVAQISGGKVPAKTEMDVAVATLKRAEASLASAKASVLQAKAELQSDETNLKKASIRSPINGVVLTREIDPGQTVAASFQAPVLFTLAENLAKMELQVDVDEADVGQVKKGQQATFTVDAWPGRSYNAVITRVGYGSQEKDGVISYLTILAVNNDDLSLRPGMTGNADIVTLVHDNALLVPNAALRYSPSSNQQNKGRSGVNFMRMLIPRPPRRTAKPAAAPSGNSPRVWVLQDGQPVAIQVKTGATNGRVTEIVGGDLKVGMKVITEDVSGSAS